MRRLTDGERDILAEQERNAREIGRSDETPSEDEIDELCESYDCLEDVWETVMHDAFPDDDTREPY
jgi:hypothetical protein